MDKLEKALEKARQQRGSATARPPVSPPPMAAGSAPVVPSPGLPESDLDLSPVELDHHRVVAFHTRNAEADVFRILRTQVLQAMAKSNLKTLAITSPNYGDGKTTIAMNLAISMAMDLKQTVLLVDLDLRKPSIHTCMGIKTTYGLTDCLMYDKPLSECIIRLPFERLTLLPAGTLTDSSSETLGSPKMVALARELKNRYSDRFIIYDMPPILAQDDPIAFMPQVDAALLVVRDGTSKTGDIKRSLQVLQDTLVIGTVLNSKD